MAGTAVLDRRTLTAMSPWNKAQARRREQGEPIRQAILAELRRRELAREPAPTWAELASAVGASERNARYHCARLRSAGLVAYTDGRMRTLRLTEAGAAED